MRQRRRAQEEESAVVKDTLPMNFHAANGGKMRRGVAEDSHLETRSFCRRACVGFTLTTCIVGITIVGIGVYVFLQMQNHKFEERNEQIYLKDLVQKVNESPNVRWKARFNPYGMKKRDFNQKSLKNITAIKHYFEKIEIFFKSSLMAEHLRTLTDFKTDRLPRHFDARTKWPLCASLHDVPNQGGCGSCFAVAAMGVASDRTCIQSNGTLNVQLSAEDVLGCCAACGNCYGGDPLRALAYWALEGVVTGERDGCRPYAMSAECGTPCLPSAYPDAEKHRKCQKTCQPTYHKKSYAEDKHMGSIAYTVYPRKMTLDQAGENRTLISSVIGHFNATSPLSVQETRDVIRKELILYGPTTFAFPVTEEFLHYNTGIFHPIPEENFEKRIIYWHVARLIGWGHDEQDRLYWLAVNSFGSEWGENGLFRIDPSHFEKFGLEYEAGLL